MLLLLHHHDVEGGGENQQTDISAASKCALNIHPSIMEVAKVTNPSTSDRYYTNPTPLNTSFNLFFRPSPPFFLFCAVDDHDIYSMSIEER
jgi:hypothetical protein